MRDAVGDNAAAYTGRQAVSTFSFVNFDEYLRNARLVPAM